MCAGAISEMYIGERLEARPMAVPPSMRQKIKALRLPASPLPIEVTANSAAAATSNHLRPNRSLNIPAARAPTRQPISAQLFTQPESPALF